MAITCVCFSDLVSTTVTKINDISRNLGDVDQLITGDSNVVDAINKITSTASIDGLIDGFSDSSTVGLGALAACNTTCPGTGNTAVGVLSLYSNTTGVCNTAVGYAAAASNTTCGTVAIGFNALTSNTTGQQNVSVGSQSMRANTTGYLNTAIGHRALFSNTTSEYNVAVGGTALECNVTGECNTAVGTQSLIANLTGDRNVGIGAFSLHANCTGSCNTAVGAQAGITLTTGVNNVVVGYQACTTGPGSNNEIVIGNTANNRLKVPGLSLDTNSATACYNLTWNAAGNGFAWVNPKNTSLCILDANGCVCKILYSI